jgi:tRNA (guanine37-N1)-methyltransferase
VILDKNPILRTVVTKVGHIEATFRYYNLECIAGVDNYETIVSEDKVKFNVDVSKMYWCSKLSSERNRLIAEFLKDG